MSSERGPLWCIVPAAGHGVRMGLEIPKQYVQVSGYALIEHTLARLLGHPDIAGVMMVLAKDDTLWPAIDTIAGKPIHTTLGGATRAASVIAGLRALPEHVADDAFVLVHDAARPCVRADDMTRLVERGRQCDGGLLAAPLRDTLKRADDIPRSLATEPREALWRAFTPQIFRRGELTRALLNASEANVEVTDEAMAMERAGFAPLLVEGAEDNIKVTTTADLALAEFLLPRTRPRPEDE